MKSGSVLHDLIDQGNWKKVYKLLLRKEVDDVNCLSRCWNRTPLHMVLMNKPKKTMEIVTSLLELKANANQRDFCGASPLYYAIDGRLNSLNLIRLLMTHGADLNCIANSGGSLLHRAVEGKNVDAVSFLLYYGLDASQKNHSNQTPLEFYVKHYKGNVHISDPIYRCIELLYDAYPIEPNPIDTPSWFLSIKRKRARFRQTALCVLGVLRRRLGVSRDMVWLIGQLLRSTRFISNWDESQ